MPFVSNTIIMCMRMRSKCINSTSGRKSVTGSEFSDIDFLRDVESFAVRRCFSSILAIFHCACAVSTTLLPVKMWRHIWIQYASFPIKTRSFRAPDTIFGDFCDDNVCACAVVCAVTSKYTKSTCGRKFVTGNGFSNPDFLWDVITSPVY